MADDEPSGLDALEAQITSYTDHKYFIPVALVAILPALAMGGGESEREGA